MKELHMHKHFSDWYRVIEIEPRGDDILKRWSGVETFVGVLDTFKALDTVRLFVGTPLGNPEFKDELANTFQKADPAFPMRENDLELRVLAGAILVHHLNTKKGNLADAIALGISTGSCVPLRANVLISDVWAIAQEYMAQEGQAIRSHRQTSVIKLQDPKPEQLLAAVQTVMKGTNDIFSEVDDMLATLREQGDILWWLHAGISRDTESMYRDMEIPEASVYAGKELSDLTALLPGPVSAPAVLDSLLSIISSPLPQAVALDAAINKLDRGWKEARVVEAGGEADGLTPVHLALRKSVEASAWVRAFEQATGSKVKNAKFGPVDLAMQMYQERLLLRAIKSTK